MKLSSTCLLLLAMLGSAACAPQVGPEPAVVPASSGADEMGETVGERGDEGSEEGLRTPVLEAPVVETPVVEAPVLDVGSESPDEPAERRDVGMDARLDAQRAAGALQVRSNRLELGEPVLFETRQPRLQPASDRAVMVVAEYLHANPRIDALRIEVHTDSQGSSTYNQAMSEACALEVARRLVSDGIDCNRLVPVGFGETRQIADNRTAEGRAKNRRVVFVIASQDGRSTGGPLDGGGRATDACRH